MRGNIVAAAAVLGVALVLGCGVLVLGTRWVALAAVDRGMARLETAVREHGRALETSVAQHGRVLETSVAQHGRALETSITTHAGATETAGERIARPQVTVADPLPIREPLKIRGVADDGALPVNATIGK